jgi:peptide/nickel transport system permease protein
MVDQSTEASLNISPMVAGGPPVVGPDDLIGWFARARVVLEWAVPLGILLVLIGMCFIWPLVYKIPSPVAGNLFDVKAPPFSPGHLLGTDPEGYDVMSRIIYGGRVSLEVGFGAVGLGMLIGTMLGSLAAYCGGVVDAIVMRLLDVLLSFPPLILATVVATYLGPSVVHIVWAISFFAIPSFARIARGQTLRVREETFISAAELAGSSRLRILFRHVIPHVLPSLLTFALLGVGVAIIVEAALSFLGLGIPIPGPSWGNMLAAGQSLLSSNPDLVLIPSAFLFVTVLSLNLLGDNLRARWAATS